MKLPFMEQTFVSCKASFDEATMVILGCPFDGGASFRPGARFGPAALRKASWGIETYSPYFRRDLSHLSIHDWGDLELPLGEKGIAFELIRKALRKILTGKKFPVLLGGDHLITLPALEEVARIYPNLRLLQLDAHTDLRDDYLGETLSHSTVMKRISERLGRGRIYQLGVRSGTKEEFTLATKMRSFVSPNKKSLQLLIRSLKNRPVYVTLDLDLLDPGLLPGVGTPEPGGLNFQEFITLLKALSSLHVVGLDIVELTPDYDPSQISSVTASVILREMILAFAPRPRTADRPPLNQKVTGK